MDYPKQTLTDFFDKIEEIKKDFGQQLESYGWTFKFNLETFGEIKYFLIINKFHTVKLVFDPQSKYIFKTTLTDVDLNRIQKLKEGLI